MDDIEQVDDIEQLVRRTVEQLGPGVDVVDCDPELADTARFVEAYGYELHDSANTIVVIGKADPPTYVACVVLAHTRLDVNRAVRKWLGVKKCSFASADDTRTVTGMEIGGVTPFALPDDLPILVDSRVMQRERIVVGGGSRSCKVVGPPSMLSSLSNVEIVDDLAKVTEPG